MWLNTIQKLWRRYTAELPPRRILEITAASTVLAFTLHFTFVGESLTREYQRPIEYSMRTSLGKDPLIDRRLRIYAFDDRALQQVQSEDLPLKSWAKIIESFAPSHPKAVVLDKLFRMPQGLEDAELFSKTIQSLDFPVITGVLALPHAGESRLDLSRPSFQVSTFAKDSDLSWVPKVDGAVQAAHPAIQESLERVGHINLSDDLLSVQSGLRLGEDTFLPRMELLLADKLEFGEKSLFLDGKSVPMDPEGGILLNLPHPRHLFSKTYSLTGVLNRIENNEPHDMEDGSVILLMYMPSLNTDQFESPFGKIAGGYTVAALINSVLTDQWLTVTRIPLFYLMVAAVFGATVGVMLSGIQFWLTVLMTMVLTFCVGNLWFSFSSYETPWALSMITILISSAAVFFEKARLIEKKTRRIRTALNGLVPPQQLQQILKNPAPLVSSDRLSTVMFIDIAGFSLSAQRQSPQDAFQSLKEVLDAITRIIHNRGGCVDKSLGDGILATFGVRYDSAEEVPGHADSAVMSALEIQRWAASQNIQSHQNEKVIYPLRIGINTGRVYVGDLGNDDRMDVTVIGQTINMAKRFETACEEYSVLIGPQTLAMATDANLSALVIRKKHIQIKHFENLVEAFEFDPLEQKPMVRMKAMKAFREQLGIERQYPRIDVPHGLEIELTTSDGRIAKVHNFSKFGLSIKMEDYLAKGVILKFELSDSTGMLKGQLHRAGLAPILGEIRWGRPLEDGVFLHGLVISNMSEKQADFFLNTLQNLLQAQSDLNAA